MYKVSYKLHKSKKPFFDLNINGMYITCLYDTGATVAVWCSSRKLFEPANMVTYDLPVTFTRESWHGRMKACRGIGASSLSDEEIAAWEKEHMAYMQTVPETFKILHYVTILDLRKMELETIITYRDMDRI